MEIRRKNINGNNWELLNESWETRNAWGHRTIVLRNGFNYGEHKVRYYNRTWEMYAFQTCMSGAIEEIKEQELNYYLTQYKDLNGITRFKKGQKEELIQHFYNDTELGKELQELKDSIRNRDFD